MNAVMNQILCLELLFYVQELLGLIFQPGYWLSWLRLFINFHSPSIQMLGYCRKIGYNHLAVSCLYCSAVSYLSLESGVASAISHVEKYFICYIHVLRNICTYIVNLQKHIYKIRFIVH